MGIWIGLLDVCTLALTDSRKIVGRYIEASHLYIIRGGRDHHR